MGAVQVRDWKTRIDHARLGRPPSTWSHRLGQRLYQQPRPHRPKRRIPGLAPRGGHTCRMTTAPVLRMVDAVTVAVPTLEEGLRVYRDLLGHELLWRNDAVGQAGLRLP